MKSFLARSGAALAGAAATGVAMAQTAPTTGLDALNGLATSSVGYGPVFYGLAVASVGIMIGVKWIKRARGAA